MNSEKATVTVRFTAKEADFLTKILFEQKGSFRAAARLKGATQGEQEEQLAKAFLCESIADRINAEK